MKILAWTNATQTETLSNSAIQIFRPIYFSIFNASSISQRYYLTHIQITSLLCSKPVVLQLIQNKGRSLYNSLQKPWSHCAHYSLLPSSPTSVFLAYPLRHTAPWAHPSHSLLRAFALPTASPWNALCPDICRPSPSFLSGSPQMTAYPGYHRNLQHPLPAL